MDIRKGYYQVPMLLEGVSKTAVPTPFGLWKFLRMPLGLKNVCQSFQCMVDRQQVTFLAPDPEAAIIESVDASNMDMFAVLQQWSTLGWQPPEVGNVTAKT
jgi:hypothetical protein